MTHVTRRSLLRGGAATAVVLAVAGPFRGCGHLGPVGERPVLT